VLHGGAAKYALVDAAYRKRFGNDNPNLDLLEQVSMYDPGAMSSRH
jgi:hypothetical protein